MRVAFYQVGASMIPVCVEMGLRIYKLGEEAMIPLETFDLGVLRAEEIPQSDEPDGARGLGV